MHKCNQCGKDFKRAHDLKRHRVSQHEDLYKCDFCVKSFSKTELKSHKCNIICKQCGKEFKRKKYLKKHLLRHKPSFTNEALHE
jgi:KRAB domain-containing zinc finger protein